MHGNTFNTELNGSVCTVWAEGDGYGKCGKIQSKSGCGIKGKGWVVVMCNDGMIVTAPFHKIALGDNSKQED